MSHVLDTWLITHPADRCVHSSADLIVLMAGNNIHGALAPLLRWYSYIFLQRLGGVDPSPFPRRDVLLCFVFTPDL